MAIIDGKYYEDGSSSAKLAEVIAELVPALESCQYELITLNPRLTPQYRKSVEACIEKARVAIAKYRAA